VNAFAQALEAAVRAVLGAHDHAEFAIGMVDLERCKCGARWPHDGNGPVTWHHAHVAAVLARGIAALSDEVEMGRAYLRRNPKYGQQEIEKRELAAFRAASGAA
jgi:hypothetical protein